MTVIPLPRHGRWAWDLRGEGRGVRISTHVDVGVLNLSLWRGGTCVGTAQLLPTDVATLAGGLTEGLAEIAAQPPAGDRGDVDGRRIHELELRPAQVEAQLDRPPVRRTVATTLGAVRTALEAELAALRALIDLAG
jgi:hypothetical protein